MKNLFLIPCVFLLLNCQNSSVSESSSSSSSNVTVNEVKTNTILVKDSNLIVINFSSFDAWRQNSKTKKMEFVKTINDSGWLEINREKSSVIVYSSKNNQKQLLEFTPFEKQDMGHVLAFSGKTDKNLMFNFIPEDSLVLIKINEAVIFQFSLKATDVTSLKSFFE